MSSSRQDERESIKANLKTWWTNFKKTGSSSKGAGVKDRGRAFSLSPTSVSSGGSGSLASERVFSESLRKSLKYASVAISMADEKGEQYIWGYVPVVVAKVGLFLKENATEVEGVFRIAGSQKRMRELQEIFDTPPKYGKHLTWERYSVHDAASVLRRYLNQMPVSVRHYFGFIRIPLTNTSNQQEPIVPLQFYNEFRNAMQKQPLDVDSAIRTYRLLIQAMPPANRYLLLYVLDLLAVFARKSDQNRMPASNLAVIFQPGIFSHPSHLQDANEHKTAVEVLEFLIEHQDHFVLGISPPPPTNVGPSELTQVSLPPSEERPDVADLSESDEELGDLIVHEGGGAQIAKRRGSDVSAGKKPSKGAFGLFRSRSSRRDSKSSATRADIVAAVADVGKPKAQDKEKAESVNFETERTPAPAQGEIHEVGLEEEAVAPQIVTAQVRRSKTLPHGRRAAGGGKRASRENQRSTSVGKSSLDVPVIASSSKTEPSSEDGAVVKDGLSEKSAGLDDASDAAKKSNVAAKAGDKDVNAESAEMINKSAEETLESAPANDVESKDAAAPTEQAADTAESAQADLPTPPPSKVIESAKRDTSEEQ